MAKDVETALIHVLAGDANNIEAGRAKLDALQTASRYQRDVY